MPLHSGTSVLIVDDDQDAGEALKTLLELEGYRVRCVADGHDALTVASEFIPDVVLLDICMPNMDGYHVCRHMRSLECLTTTKIVAFSALSGTEHDQRCANAGFNERLAKPLDFRRLAKLLSDGI